MDSRTVGNKMNKKSKREGPFGQKWMAGRGEEASEGGERKHST